MDKVKCPVCGGKADKNGFNEIADMCNRCFWYLSPDSNGVDLGFLMYRIRIAGYGGLRTMEIRPRGFWGDSIQVYEMSSLFADLSSPVEIEVSWSSGGVDGSLNSVDTAHRFREALGFAINIAETWKIENERR